MDPDHSVIKELPCNAFILITGYDNYNDFYCFVVVVAIGK